MTTVGVRELRQRASELLRLVETGQTIEITDRGRPVAVLSGIPRTGDLEQLRARGDVVRASASLDDLPEPLETQPDSPTPTETLARLRHGER